MFLIGDINWISQPQTFYCIKNRYLSSNCQVDLGRSCGRATLLFMFQASQQHFFWGPCETNSTVVYGSRNRDRVLWVMYRLPQELIMKFWGFQTDHPPKSYFFFMGVPVHGHQSESRDLNLELGFVMMNLFIKCTLLFLWFLLHELLVEWKHVGFEQSMVLVL